MKYTMMIVVGGNRISVRRSGCKIDDVRGCMPHEPMCVQEIAVSSLIKSTSAFKAGEAGEWGKP